MTNDINITYKMITDMHINYKVGISLFLCWFINALAIDNGVYRQGKTGKKELYPFFLKQLFTGPIKTLYNSYGHFTNYYLIEMFFKLLFDLSSPYLYLMLYYLITRIAIPSYYKYYLKLP
jgi:hypothetical protein